MSGSRFRWCLTCLQEFVPGAGVVRRSCFRFALLAAALSKFSGVMRCDGFFLFPYVGSHLSSGLLPPFFESQGFCSCWFFAGLIAVF